MCLIPVVVALCELVRQNELYQSGYEENIKKTKLLGKFKQ